MQQITYNHKWCCVACQKDHSQKTLAFKTSSGQMCWRQVCAAQQNMHATPEGGQVLPAVESEIKNTLPATAGNANR